LWGGLLCKALLSPSSISIYIGMVVPQPRKGSSSSSSNSSSKWWCNGGASLVLVDGGERKGMEWLVTSPYCTTVGISMLCPHSSGMR